MRDEQRTVLNGISKIVADELGLDQDLVVGSEAARTKGVCIGLSLPAKTGTNVAPFYHMDEHIEDVLQGRATPEEVAHSLVEQYRKFEDPFNGVHINRDFILDNCRTRVVPAEKNAALLQSCPHRMLCDLAEIVYFTLETANEGSTGICIVDYKIVERFSFQEDELFKKARENVEKNSILINMSEVLGLFDEPVDAADEYLFIATNEERVYGAAVLGCPDFLKKCREKIGCDVYVIPSSVHEVLLLKKGEHVDAKSVAEVIRDVNTNEVQEDEVLSYSLYELDENGNVKIAA